MQLKTGDMVVHPSYGIGHIAGIEEKRFAQQEAQWYYKVMLSKRTLWLPVETQKASGLRLITAKNELDYYRNLLKSPPSPLEKNHHRRHPALLNRLREGSFQVLCEVVRDLTAWGWRKPLGPTDMATLQKIRQSLYQEWATAAGISTFEASKEVDSLLQATR
jgi:RNA polymerase-interacting CarD/CdnL/TRCF family regulator